jgi:hypothetical protein
MGIYRTTNSAEFDDVDGIIINEQSPSANIQGVAANTAILVGQFQRGPVNELTLVGSIAELNEIFGKSDYSGNLQLRNKKFGILKLIRAAAAAAVKGTKTFKDAATPTPLDAITFEALYFGVYGNKIKVTIEAGSTTGKKYTIQDTNDDAVLMQEVYDNIIVTAKTQLQLDSLFSGSKLVKAVKATVTATAEPDNCAATALANGSDGTIADSDYTTAIAVAEQERSGNVLWTDKYSATIRAALKTHLVNAPDKMVILAHDDETKTYSDAVSDVATYRDTDGRIIYAFNHLKTVINGLDAWQSPAPWVASIISLTAPHIDPAFAENVKYLLGASDVYYKLSRAAYIALKNAGVAAFENDADLGIKLKSGIVTQIANSSKLTVLRRRMADYLQDSIAYYLKNYQNAVNSATNRKEVKAAVLAFDNGLINDGILPSDNEVSGGNARLVDCDSLNTDLSIGQGYFKLLYKRRIYSSMRYIVLTAEIGESVVVTEGE